MRSFAVMVLLIAMIVFARVESLTARGGAGQDAVDSLLGAKNSAERQSWLEAHKALVTRDLWSALTDKGLEYYNVSKNDDALRAHDAALQIATALQDDVLVGESKHQLGRAYKSLGRLTDALSLYVGAQKNLPQSDQRSHPYLAYLYKDIVILYRDQGDFENGKRYVRQSLELGRPLGDPLVIGLAHLVLGSIHMHGGDYPAAVSELETSRPYFVESKSDKYLTDVALNLGRIYALRGYYAQSFLQYQQAETLLHKLNQPQRLAQLYRNQASLYWGQGENDKMRELLRKSLKLAREIKDHELITNNLLDLGTAASLERDFKNAGEYLTEGLKLAEQSNNPAQLSTAQFGLGFLSTETGNYESAQDLYEKALGTALRIGDKAKIAALQWALASIHAKKKDYAKALSLSEKAAAAASELDIPDLQSYALTVKGEAHLQQRQFAHARKALLEAIDLIEAGRARVTGDTSAGATFLAERVRAYQLLVSLNLAEGKTTEALLASERAKGRSLLDVITRGRGAVRQTMSAAEQKQADYLSAEAVKLNSQLYSAEQNKTKNDAEIARLKGRLGDARLAFENFLNSVRAREQRLREQAGGASQTVTLEQIQTLIPNEGATLVYSVTPDALHLFVLTRDARIAGGALDIKTYTINISENQLSARTSSFRESLATRKLDVRSDARELYDLLIKPVAQELAGKSLVCVIPDGSLWELPFQTLMDDNGNFFLEKAAIYYAPSLSVLSRMRDDAKATPPTSSPSAQLIAFGNPSESLPDAVTEVKSSAEFYPANRTLTLIGAAANEQVFKREGGKYRLIHFATHGILDDQRPLYSRLILSRSGEEDGFLEAWEIMNLDLSADMAILSACDTARGRVSSGEGLIGMSWAFFVSGVPATVVSQWEVYSPSTSRLMIEFHRQLTRSDAVSVGHLSKAEALRRAALSLMKVEKFNEPYFWGGFVIVGDGS